VAFIAALAFVSCDNKVPETKEPPRVFLGYHPLLDTIIRSKQGVFRGLNLNADPAAVKAAEAGNPVEASSDHLFYEYSADSLTNYSIDYAFAHNSLEEINVQINISDLDLTNYLFCDLRDYYANKLPNPTEDKGYVIYNCFEGERKPFVVSLSDNSSPSNGQINMVIYRDR
jgi:hypothetical protein